MEISKNRRNYKGEPKYKKYPKYKNISPAAAKKAEENGGSTFLNRNETL